MGGITVRIDVLSLFPQVFEGFLSESILARAIKNDLVDIHITNFRDFTESKHKKVDDTPYGGGAGMVLQAQPVIDALRSIDGYQDALKIIVSPQGEPFTQEEAYRLSSRKHIILLCGHYEGYDERIRSYFDLELSIGDYVLTGGELAAMVLIDAITRVIPSVIGKDESHINDSFHNHLLEHPHYTRPRVYEGKEVPEVLLNGNHKLIEEWRIQKSIEKTKRVRKDLYKAYMKEKKKL